MQCSSEGVVHAGIPCNKVISVQHMAQGPTTHSNTVLDCLEVGQACSYLMGSMEPVAKIDVLVVVDEFGFILPSFPL